MFKKVGQLMKGKNTPKARKKIGVQLKLRHRLLLLITHRSTKPPEANTATHAPPQT